MDIIDIDSAVIREWDVVIAGSSFAAMFFSHGLPEHLDVLVVEKGAHYTHADQITHGWARLEEFRQVNGSGYEKRWPAYTLLGGNSNYWWGDAPRMHPDDFRMQTRFGIEQDWPFGYDEIEPYWQKVEQLIEISGGGSDHILPRRVPYPYPAHKPSRADVTLMAHSALWVPMPCGRSNGGSRPQCCANGVCSRCPIDAKFTMLNGLARIAHPRARILLETELRALETAGGRAGAAILRSRDGEEARVRASTFALGTNGIFNAAILLRSGLGGPAAGRYLHEQATREVIIDTATIRNFYGGTSETLHGYHFYHDVDRHSAAAVLIESTNSPPNFRHAPGKWTNRLRLNLVAEDIPQPQNRVVLEDDEPLIQWSGHHAYAFAGLDRAIAGLPDIIPDGIEDLWAGPLSPSEAHIQGTHRIGADPATSVVDDRLRLHDAPNVFALGCGAFPTCSPANPSLTLSALALRAAEVVT